MGWDEEFEALGKASDSKKIEGDKRAPAGIFSLGQQFGIDKTIVRNPAKYLTVTPTLGCVDDKNFSEYNKFIPDHNKFPSKSSEHIAEYTSTGTPISKGDLYDQGIVINSNRNATPGKGSCVFLHIWREKTRDGTLGCIATSRENMTEITKWMDSKKRPVIVQMPSKQYGELRSGCTNLKLPAMEQQSGEAPSAKIPARAS